MNDYINTPQEAINQYRQIPSSPTLIMNTATFNKLKSVEPEIDEKYDIVKNDIVEDNKVYVTDDLSNFHNPPKYNPRNF